MKTYYKPKEYREEPMSWREFFKEFSVFMFVLAVVVAGACLLLLGGY